MEHNDRRPQRGRFDISSPGRENDRPGRCLRRHRPAHTNSMFGSGR